MEREKGFVPKMLGIEIISVPVTDSSTAESIKENDKHTKRIRTVKRKEEKIRKKYRMFSIEFCTIFHNSWDEKHI